MKILDKVVGSDRTLITVYYDDNTYATLNMKTVEPVENMLHDVYIISKDARNRLPWVGEIPTDVQEWNPPTPKAARLVVEDWRNLQGKVYDQYGSEMETEILFSIEGEQARIENGKIVEDVVDTDTSYFIVAKYGDLEERQERTIFAPQEAENSKLI